MTYESTTRQCNRLVNRYTIGVQENILENKRPVTEFLDVIGTKVLRAFLLGVHSQSGLKMDNNRNIVFGILKSENSQDYAQKSQRNLTFMNSASGW
jgi:hypothetical protein